MSWASMSPVECCLYRLTLRLLMPVVGFKYEISRNLRDALQPDRVGTLFGELGREREQGAKSERTCATTRHISLRPGDLPATRRYHFSRPTESRVVY